MNGKKAGLLCMFLGILGLSMVVLNLAKFFHDSTILSTAKFSIQNYNISIENFKGGFSDELIKEYFKNGGIEDKLIEVFSEKITLSIKEAEKYKKAVKTDKELLFFVLGAICALIVGAIIYDIANHYVKKNTQSVDSRDSFGANDGAKKVNLNNDPFVSNKNNMYATTGALMGIFMPPAALIYIPCKLCSHFM